MKSRFSTLKNFFIIHLWLLIILSSFWSDFQHLLKQLTSQHFIHLQGRELTTKRYPLSFTKIQCCWISFQPHLFGFISSTSANKPDGPQQTRRTPTNQTDPNKPDERQQTGRVSTNQTNTNKLDEDRPSLLTTSVVNHLSVWLEDFVSHKKKCDVTPFDQQNRI